MLLKLREQQMKIWNHGCTISDAEAFCRAVLGFLLDTTSSLKRNSVIEKARLVTLCGNAEMESWLTCMVSQDEVFWADFLEYSIKFLSQEMFQNLQGRSPFKDCALTTSCVGNGHIRVIGGNLQQLLFRLSDNVDVSVVQYVVVVPAELVGSLQLVDISGSNIVLLHRLLSLPIGSFVGTAIDCQIFRPQRRLGLINTFQRLNIKCVGHLVLSSEILIRNNFGRTGARSITTLLETFGLRLSMEPADLHGWKDSFRK
jgi:hypothetical protein